MDSENKVRSKPRTWPSRMWRRDISSKLQIRVISSREAMELAPLDLASGLILPFFAEFGKSN